MTLKEKFTKVEFEKYVEQKDINSRAEFEKIADEFAIGFAEWLQENDGATSYKELLKIYKKEKAL